MHAHPHNRYSHNVAAGWEWLIGQNYKFDTFHELAHMIYHFCMETASGIVFSSDSMMHTQPSYLIGVPVCFQFSMHASKVFFTLILGLLARLEGFQKHWFGLSQNCPDSVLLCVCGKSNFGSQIWGLTKDTCISWICMLLEMRFLKNNPVCFHHKLLIICKQSPASTGRFHIPWDFTSYIIVMITHRQQSETQYNLYSCCNKMWNASSSNPHTHTYSSRVNAQIRCNNDDNLGLLVSVSFWSHVHFVCPINHPSTLFSEIIRAL